MMFRVFSLKNILWGILLGLIFVGVWMYYPELTDHFRSSAPEVKKKVTSLLHDQEERLKPYVERISIDLDRKREAFVYSLSKKDKEPEATHDESPHEETPEEIKAEKRVEPYYASEESRWQELVGRPIHTDYVDAYPHHECFKAGATEYKVPLSLVLGLAAYLSNFDQGSLSDQKAGIMHLGWPDPSRGMGVQKKEDLINDPCTNIRLGCRFLADLFSQSKGEWVPVLVAYRNQISVVRRDKITREDLLFSEQLRSQVEKILDEPFEKKGMYPFLAFNSRKRAEDFIGSIKRRTDLDLWVGEKAHMYMVFIPAADEKEKDRKATLILEKTGIHGK